MKNSIEDSEKLANKLSESDKKKISEAIQESLTWLKENQNAPKEDF